MGDSRLRRSAYAMASGGNTAAVEASNNGIVAGTVDSAFTAGRREANSILEGRISLVLMEGIVLGIVGFYVWTHGIQGGG